MFRAVNVESSSDEGNADASQLGVRPNVLLNLGCFNCGMVQGMLSKPTHQKNLSRVIAKGVCEQELHMLTLCEVGGHKQGLDESTVKAEDLIKEVLTPEYKATSCQAYMATWQADDNPIDDTSVTLKLVGEPEVVNLDFPVEPQLVIMVFTIASAKHPEKHGLLISGQLHIRTPTGWKTSQTIIKKRKEITELALQTLEQRASTASSGASQPTAPVLVLTGDVNMDKSACESLVQKQAGEPAVETQWQVLTSNAAKSGDVLFIKGAFGKAFDVTVGISYPDRGVRNDQHDFFGVSLKIPMSDKNPRGQKRPQASAGSATHPVPKDKRVTPKNSASGAAQPAAPLPEDPGEKRMAENNVAYTKASFLAFYSSREYAEEVWAAARPVGRTGPINAVTGRVIPRAEKIVQEMYDWYEARAEDEELHAVFRHLQHTLFKNVTVQRPEDVWKHPDVGGASQPAAQGEAHMVVCREHLARQVQTVIAWREKWLKDKGLPLTTEIRDDLADDFLNAAKYEFHSPAEQEALQERDRLAGKKIQTGKHSRWSRHTQKLGGTTQMWTLLSFTGRFDVAFLEESIAKGEKKQSTMPGERTEKQKQEVRDAQMARARLRRGAMLVRLQEKLLQGDKAGAHSILCRSESCKSTKAECCESKPTSSL